MRNIGPHPPERVLAISGRDDFEFHAEKLGVHLARIGVILNEKHARDLSAIRLGARHQ